MIGQILGLKIFAKDRPTCGSVNSISKALLLTACLLSYLVTSEAATPSNALSPIGSNLNSVNYWSSQQPFLNIFKTSGGWFTQTATRWSTGEEDNIPLDADGYPTRLDGFGADGRPVNYTMLGILLQRQATAPFYPAGQYVVLYDGEGSLSYSFNAALVSSSPGRDVINVATPTSAGILVRLRSTNPANYLRNIRIVHSSQEAALLAGAIFNPELLDRLKKYRVLRFMDWMRTNGSAQAEWADRPTASRAFYGDSKGVPLEVMSALSNELEADPWFNMPHLASDDYVAQFADMAHSLLTKNQKVYVEYSNETWNFAFPQATWVQNSGRAFWPNANVTLFDLNRNFHGMKTAQVCDIWKGVWGADANRVVCVLGAQAANSWGGLRALKCSLWADGPCDKKHGVGTIAIAPYFGYNVPDTFTVDQLFEEMLQGGVMVDGYPGGMVKRSLDRTRAYATLAVQNGVEMIAYEGGQHLVGGNNPNLVELYSRANKDPRMAAAYATYLNGWKAAGGLLFNHFNDVSDQSRWGNWGTLENVMHTSSAKFDALMAFINENACWWTGCEGS